MSSLHKNQQTNAKLRFLDNLFEEKEEPKAPYTLMKDVKAKPIGNLIKTPNRSYLRWTIIIPILLILYFLFMAQFIYKSTILCYLSLIIVCFSIALLLDYFYFRKYVYMYSNIILNYRPNILKKFDDEFEKLKEYKLIDI